MSEDLGKTNTILGAKQRRIKLQLQEILSQIRTNKQSLTAEGEVFVVEFTADATTALVRISNYCIQGHLWEAGMSVILQHMGERYTLQAKAYTCSPLRRSCNRLSFLVEL